MTAVGTMPTTPWPRSAGTTPIARAAARRSPLARNSSTKHRYGRMDSGSFCISKVVHDATLVYQSIVAPSYSVAHDQLWANFRLRECQPRPRFGSSPANSWAFCHQSRGCERLTHVEGSFGAGSKGTSPIPGFFLRASSRAASASEVTGVRCSYPVFSCSPRHRTTPPSRSMSDHLS